MPVNCIKIRNKKMRKAFIGVIGILLASNAVAYIDPGTGGMIAGSLWPFIVGILAAIGGFCVKYFYKPVKKGIIHVWQKIKRD